MSTKSNSKNRPRLGRGLNSLLSISDLPVQDEIPQPPSPAIEREITAVAAESAPSVAPAELNERTQTEIPIHQISPNPHQPRKVMNDASIAELGASIRSTGLIQPIIVRNTEAGYQIIAGERRWRAAKIAGLTSIPAIVRDVDSFTQAQMALVENIQREDLNPIDRASGYRTLMDQLGLTQSELASRLGEDRSSIANFLRLLDLTETVRSKVRDGTLSVGHAKLLAGVTDVLEQQRLADLIVGQGLSVRNLERLLQDGVTPAAATTTSAPASSAHIADLEKSIARQIGMRVQVRSGSKGKGRLVIHYSSLDQFDELMAKLGVATE